MINYYNTASHDHDEEEGMSANVPPRSSKRQHSYQPDDVVELVESPARPASFRRAIPGINCPDDTSSWADIADFRAKWGLPPVTR